MDIIFKLLVICISLSGALAQLYVDQTTPISGINVVSASYELYSTVIAPQCVDRTSVNPGQIERTTGQSIENFIALVERLELRLANDSNPIYRALVGAENVARILLRRFRFDGYDPEATGLPYQRSRDSEMNRLNNIILSRGDGQANPDLQFPDNWFNLNELCSMYYMLSHNVYNVSDSARVPYSAQVFRGKRQAQYGRQQQHTGGQYPNSQNQNVNQRQNPYPNNQVNRQYAPNAVPNTNNLPVSSNYVRAIGQNQTDYPIKEEGVVSFRGDKSEAIALARVLIGVVAGLTANAQTSVSQILAKLGGIPADPGWESKSIDPLMAVTLADLWGSVDTKPVNDKTYIYSVTGQWGLTSTSCTKHYSLTTVLDHKKAISQMKATKAEIRGGVDGYFIGKGLRELGQVDVTKLKLSEVLRSYYSKPRISSTTATKGFSVSYCDRRTTIDQALLSQTATNYAYIIAKSTGAGAQTPTLNSDFNQALQTAQQIELGDFTNYCVTPSGGVPTETAPCETPSDVIFIIDGSTVVRLQKSAEIVSKILGNVINFRIEGGTTSIFFNSQGGSSSDLQLPVGPGGWPFTAAVFNSTNTGCAVCRIDDFSNNYPQSVANLGLYFKYLNQTLMNYEYWGPRTNFSAVPAKSAVLIDLGGLVDSAQNQNDYNNYKNQLRYRHRDVRFLAVADNTTLFRDILRDENDKESPTNLQVLGSNLGRKICENPATFQYMLCHERRSDGVKYEGYITPGYLQNWAMYPEFFLKSFDIRFTFKGEDGNIRVCYDREFPPKRNDAYYCKDITAGQEDGFSISNPCKGESEDSCRPFYFTVWGIQKTTQTQCLDDKCLNLDQIKFTVTHSGVQCNSSNHLLPSITFQIISTLIFAILYLFSNKQ